MNASRTTEVVNQQPKDGMERQSDAALPPEGYSDPARPRNVRLDQDRLPPWVSRIPAEHDAAGELNDK